MITKNNKVITFTSIIAAVLVMGGAILSASNIKLNVNNLLRGRATEIVSGSISYTRNSPVTSGTISSGVCTATATLPNGLTYLANVNGDSNPASYFARFTSSSHNITFAFASNPSGVDHFQSITSVGFVISSYTGSANFDVYYSTTTTFSESKKVNVTYSNPTADLSSVSAKYIKIVNNSGEYAYITSLAINYKCNPSGESEATLESIAVKTAPSTTSYTEGDYFDPTGLVITATYDDSSTEDVAYSGNEANFSFSPSLSTALTTGDTSVTITYSGKSCSQSITVEESAQGLSGTYAGTYTSIEFTSSTQGVYIYGSERLYFTYSVSGTSITFTYSSGDNTNFGSYRLFAGGSSPKVNATGSITSSNTISVKTYNMFDSATSRTFTK